MAIDKIISSPFFLVLDKTFCKRRKKKETDFAQFGVRTFHIHLFFEKLFLNCEHNIDEHFTKGNECRMLTVVSIQNIEINFQNLPFPYKTVFYIM